ncbi:MAG: hypothetical protein CLLPBCKN_001723 [Chroococcidiopsis cubana SAG 39.79]|uniref:hypothetical protein n=1 Tax=Chroococcidiopsis cubana TaxID=171392 RepID=UPI002AC37B38|nr:hypothetical protein [Chroococcidiopsis cubana]MDZ4872335.1 hypothetical protein [Chroococcidiopsis cubana SAG 39.79]
MRSEGRGKGQRGQGDKGDKGDKGNSGTPTEGVGIRGEGGQGSRGENQFNIQNPHTLHPTPKPFPERTTHHSLSLTPCSSLLAPIPSLQN